MVEQNKIFAEKLKTVWVTAAERGRMDFDYTGDPNAESDIYRLRNALYNYRRFIRRNKLKYPDVWKAMLSVEIIIISKTHIVIQWKKPKPRLDIKIKAPLPFSVPDNLCTR